jgi:amino acid adenylation domain-containing protein
MSGLSRLGTDPPSRHQQSIRAKCFHPTGKFIEFKKEEIEQSIPDRFEEQVAKYPDRLAVKSSSYALTYDELNKAANQVARAILAQRGEGQEPIALVFGKGTPLIITILGALKAGKIYLPLNPTYPRLRNLLILKDSQAGLIVTDNENLPVAREQAGNGVQLLNIDAIDSSLSTENLGLSISPDALAYILNTSGSTGRPKGVVQKHRNLLHVVMRTTNALHICADDRLTFLGSRGGDVFHALLNGAAVYPVNDKAGGLADLANWLIQEEVTVYHSVATVFRHFVSTLTATERFPKLRLIRLHGESAHRRDVELYKKHFAPDCIFVTQIGSIETGHFRLYFVDKKTQITGSIVPLGYAVEGMKVLLLNEDDKRLGFNQAGEITVKSRYLSAGYWRRSDLTKATFLADPEGTEERIYRTGDLGSMQPDGCLVYHGRKDFRVKIRGNTVEVADIEMALLDLAAVKEAVVVAREDVPGNKRLVAYIVPAIKPAPTIGAIRRGLAEKLPDYMIPSAVVIMDTLPLTGIGKVDRRALSAPDRARPDLENTFVAPRTPAEEVLARVWAKVLGLERVGIHDNFLELGGHSLLATQIISRVFNTFHVEVPVRALFEAPTVADMAEVITQNGAKKAKQEDLTRILAELEALSDEEAQHLLKQETREKEL